MRSSSIHVAIVGAGPAGSSAATLLARRGARVSLLEQRAFPRDKVCGDGLSPIALRFLEHLHPGDLALAEYGQPVSRAYFRAPHGATFLADLPNHLFAGRAAVVRREVLDHWLVQGAVRAGASLYERADVRSLDRDRAGVRLRLRNGQHLRADLVLGCDGSPSVVRRALGAAVFPPKHSAFALRLYYEDLELPHADAFGFFFEKNLLPGYGWIFPLPGRRANVGIMVPTVRLATERAKLPEMLDRFCSSSAVRGLLDGGRRCGRAKGHHLPLGTFAHDLVFDRALLLGDAAGFIDPLTGEGIHFALESSALAADAVLKGDAAGDLSAEGLSEYTVLCAERLRRIFILSSRIRLLFKRQRFVDRVLRTAERSPQVFGQLVEVLLGERPRIGWRLLSALVLGI